MRYGPVKLKIKKGRDYSMDRTSPFYEIATTRENATDGRKGLDRCAMATLLLLVTTADKDGRVAARLDDIAHSTGYGRAQTHAAMKILRERGYVAEERRSVYRIPDSVAWPQNPSSRGILPTAS